MPVRYFVQHQDLQDLKENLATNPLFHEFIQTLPENDYYTNEHLVSKYIERVEDRHTTHFKQWKEKCIHMSLSCDDPTPQIISAWLLVLPIQEEPPLTLYSSTHRTIINTKELIPFLISDMDPSELR